MAIPIYKVLLCNYNMMHVLCLSDTSELIRVPIGSIRADSDEIVIEYEPQFSDEILWPSECGIISHPVSIWVISRTLQVVYPMMVFLLRRW